MRNIMATAAVLVVIAGFAWMCDNAASAQRTNLTICELTPAERYREMTNRITNVEAMSNLVVAEQLYCQRM